MAIASIIGIAIYASFPNTTGIIILGLLGIFSIWLGLKIFKRVRIIGPIEFLTAVHASPDLDNLEPTEKSETKRRNPEEIVGLLETNDNVFQGGSFRIFGDWFGKPHDNHHEIIEADYDEKLNKLTLGFKEGEKLEIYNPKHIFEASTFLKIVQADRVKLTWFDYDKTRSTKNQYFLDYKLTGKKITTETDVDWYKPVFDVSLAEPALMIYG